MQYALRILLTPSCWMRNNRTCPHLSRFIRARLAAGEKPIVLNQFRCQLGGKQLWIENFPYAYGNDMGVDAYGPLPDRRTVFMLYDAVRKAMYGEEAR